MSECLEGELVEGTGKLLFSGSRGPRQAGVTSQGLLLGRHLHSPEGKLGGFRSTWRSGENLMSSKPSHETS